MAPGLLALAKLIGVLSFPPAHSLAAVPPAFYASVAVSALFSGVLLAVSLYLRRHASLFSSLLYSLA